MGGSVEVTGAQRSTASTFEAKTLGLSLEFEVLYGFDDASTNARAKPEP
jgi:hypothetical protein